MVKEDYCINGCPLDVAEETEVYPAILDIIFITEIIITVIITVTIITIRFIAPSSTWWRLSGSPVGWMRFPKVEVVRSLRLIRLTNVILMTMIMTPLMTK